MTGLSYVAIDFETANENYSSACSIGMTKVVNSRLIDSYYSLINPEETFSPNNIKIHGIHQQDVQTAPNMAAVSDSLFHFVDGLPLVAHNAPFDMRVLQESLRKYHLACPKLNYFCSLALSRNLLSLNSYRLNSVADYYHIHFHHHQAADDAKVCAEIVLHMFQQTHRSSIEEMARQLHYQIGVINQHSFTPFTKKRASRFPNADFKPSDIVAQNHDFDPNHPFYQKTIVFSGTLRTMERREACQKVADLGGINGNNVTKKTNYLVSGEQDYRLLKGHKKSSKVRKAEQLASEGQDIRVLTENEFIRLMQS